MSTKTPGRAALYCRISRDDDDTALGVERQRRDCLALVDRKGWTLADTYTDNDFSAFNGKARPEYRRLLEDLKAGAVDTIVAWHPDRLHRSPRELEDFIDIVESTGAAVVTVSAGDYDLSHADGRFVARTLGNVATKESEDKSRRLRRKHQELAELGRWKGGPRPYGYDVARDAEGRPRGDGTLQVVEAEAEVIREAARRVLAGDSVYAVVSDLNARNIPTAQGAPWRTPTLRRILTSPTTGGRRSYRGADVGPAAWPAILDEAMLLRLRATIADPSRAVGARPARRYLLSGGLAVCGRCGAHLHAQRRQSGAPGYACVAGPDKGGCGRLTVSAQPLEELVPEAGMLRLATPYLAAEIGREAQDPEVVAKVAALEARLDELADLWAEGSIDRARWLRANQKINRDLKAARSQLARASRITVLDGVTGEGVLRKAWPTLGLDRRRAILSAVIDKVVVNPSSTRGRNFDPGRVDVIWRV